MSITRRTLIQAAAAALMFSVAPVFANTDVAGVKFEETASVAGQQLKLNGAGLRTKFFVKVYALGLYLSEKKSSTAEILALQGARRIQIVSMRDISSEDFSKAFMDGLNANTEQAERNKILPQIKAFGELFASIPSLKKGDVLLVDWVPGVGTQCQLNGKKIGETVPDLAFYNAITRIWIGDKAADSSLKPKLLGEAK